MPDRGGHPAPTRRLGRFDSEFIRQQMLLAIGARHGGLRAIAIFAAVREEIQVRWNRILHRNLVWLINNGYVTKHDGWEDPGTEEVVPVYKRTRKPVKGPLLTPPLRRDALDPEVAQQRKLAAQQGKYWSDPGWRMVRLWRRMNSRAAKRALREREARAREKSRERTRRRRQRLREMTWLQASAKRSDTARQHERGDVDLAASGSLARVA